MLEFQHTAARRRLRRCQPGEPISRRFNTQPPEGGCPEPAQLRQSACWVSTHSRPKAAAKRVEYSLEKNHCFNTQPPEGGCQIRAAPPRFLRCFNTQPPEGGCLGRFGGAGVRLCFNTQPPEGGCSLLKNSLKIRQLEATFR